MASFTSTPDGQGVPNRVGDRKITTGSYTATPTGTGGDINTGLKVCEHIVLQKTSSTTALGIAAANETFPTGGSDVTIVTPTGEGGLWKAYGY